MTRGGRVVDLGIPGYGEAEQVGRGGFAVVYRAWQPAFSRPVAVKVISATLDPTGVERFARECRAIGALSGHPNVVTVYEMGLTGDGRPFISMEYLPGGSLGERMASQGPLPWPQALEVGIRLAGALAWAHGRHVLHRDVKPDNVLVSRFGEHKLADFGIARVPGGHETEQGVVTASFAYAAPEVVAAQRPTEASDVYSLGATIFALIVGQAPFVRPDESSLLPLLARISGDAVPDLRPRGVPEEICRVIEEALSKDPAQRPPSAETLGRRLQDAQAAAGLAVTHLPLDADKAAREAAAFTVRIPADQLPTPVAGQDVTTRGPAFDDTGVLPAAAPPGPTTPPAHRRRRGLRRQLVAVVAGLIMIAAAAVGVAVLGTGGDGDGIVTAGSVTSTNLVPTATTAPPLLIEDDFSNPSTGWSRTDTPEYVTEYANGQYRVVLRKIRISLPRLPRPSGSGFGDVRVEVDARTVTEAPVEFGVVCRYGGPGQPYYDGRISPSGFWVIGRQVSGQPQRTTLATGSTTFMVSGEQPRDRLYRVALECAGADPVTLRLYVNGAKVGEIVDQDGVPGGNVGVTTATRDAEPVEVLYDNFLARRPA